MIFSIKTTQSANILTNIISKLTSYNWIRNLENKQNIEFKNKHNKKITLSSAQETNSSETQIFVDYQSQNSLPIQFAKLVQDSAGKVK